MKLVFFLFANLILAVNLFGQEEFKTYSNGLIYNEETMDRLSHIVDSLNLRYKICDKNKVFYSKSQTVGCMATIEGKNVKSAKSDMDKGMSWSDWVLKYSNAKVQKDVLIVKFQNKDYEGIEVVSFSDVAKDYGLEIIEENKKGFAGKNLKGQWLYNYSPKTTYSTESLSAFYFPDTFKSIPLELKYCWQIGYSDCLIDTTTNKFKTNSQRGGLVELPEHWEDSSMGKKIKLLDELRSVNVVGGCSRDRSPRIHAMNIALLSASTANWEVFLKSHLDIMNDRFERVSDGSYAWTGRNTYIKELEDLDINVVDLLIGISLRIENPATNHYYGSIGRLGRAIAESKNRLDFEQQILSMIEDDKLDDYNRLLSCYLFLNYTYYLEDEKLQLENREKLKVSVSKLPGFLSQSIKIVEEK